MRKLVQNGITSSRMRRPLLAPARVAMKYASGSPTRRQAIVPMTAICRLVMNGLVLLDRPQVVVQDEAGLVATVLRPDAEREDDHDRQRQDEQDQVPEARRQQQDRVSSRPPDRLGGRLAGRRRAFAGGHRSTGTSDRRLVSRRWPDLNSSRCRALLVARTCPGRLRGSRSRPPAGRSPAFARIGWIDELRWRRRSASRTG